MMTMRGDAEMLQKLEENIRSYVGMYSISVCLPDKTLEKHALGMGVLCMFIRSNQFHYFNIVD